MADNRYQRKMSSAVAWHLDPSVYGRLVRDGRISHGAFRLWHYLRDRARKDSGKAWPEQRVIAFDIHCKPHSLTAWIAELVDSSYLATRRVGQSHHLEYTVLDGGISRVAQKGNAACCPKGGDVLPKGATPRVAGMGNVIKIIEEKTERETPTRQRWQVQKELDRVEARIEELKNDTGFWTDNHGCKRPNNSPTPAAKEKIAKLKEQRKGLLDEFDNADE